MSGQIPVTVARIVTLFLFGALCSCAWLPFGPGELRFTNAELTERLARRFPVERSVGGLLDITISRPRAETRIVTGVAARFGTSFDITVKLPLTGKTLNGAMSISGLPHYDAASRSIFLRDAKVDSIRTDGMPDALSAALAKAASSMARDILEEKPVQTLKEDDLKRFGLATSPLRIEVRQDGLVLLLK
jgi:hypothetical protein